jgi:hypothetical protein
METIDFIPLVKAYPALSKTYGEVSCIAGVQPTTDGPRWIRLYPVPFRALQEDQQFAKYQPMTVRAEPHSGDRRPETRRPDRDSIKIAGPAIPSANGWRARRRFVAPLMVESMCAVRRQQRKDGTSLAVFRPRQVLDIVIEPADVKEEKQSIARAWVSQTSLLDGLGTDEREHQLRELEFIPWTFKYRYLCSDPACQGHTQSIIDWEIARTYRRVRTRPDWQERLKARWLDDLCGDDKDTAFFVGNQHLYPDSFLVLGVWWPPKQPEQLAMPGLP